MQLYSVSSWRKPRPITTGIRIEVGLRGYMPSDKTYFVYILASGHHGTLYIGVTNDLRSRLELHRSGRGLKFVSKYRIHRLVHVEAFASPLEAIAREKQLKNWRRDWKIELIEKENLDWRDLSGLI
jgi:putative endonuclease